MFLFLFYQNQYFDFKIMSKKNDPAFLFYSKDWIQGTAQMTNEEKGIYIDLLAHQHQDNGLPISTLRLSKLSNLPENEFLKIWDYLKYKFVEMDGKLFNLKLVEVMTGRSQYTEMRTIIGTFGGILRDMQISDDEKSILRKLFKYSDFLDDFRENKPNLSSCIAFWVAKAQATYGDGIGIENGNYIKNSSIVSKMFEIFKNYNKNYPFDKNKDFTACFQIAVKIGISKGWEQKDILNGKQKEVLEAWEKIACFIVSDDWFSTRSIFDLNTEWQRLIQKMQNKNGTKRNNGSSFSNGANLSGNAVIQPDKSYDTKF